MTTVLAVLGVLVVLFVVAAVALRDEAVLVEAPPDRADLALPDEGPVTAGDLERLRFGMALRGYRMAQVDEVLDRLADELLERDEQLAALTQRGGPAARAARRRRPRRLEAFRRPTRQRPRARRRPATASWSRAAVPSAARGCLRCGGGGAGGADRQRAAHRDRPRAGDSEPPVEHVPDSGEGAEPLPGVRTLPDASPPDAVPFPEPVHTDEPVRAPDQPDARGGAGVRTQPAALVTARDAAVVGAEPRAAPRPPAAVAAGVGAPSRLTPGWRPGGGVGTLRA